MEHYSNTLDSPLGPKQGILAMKDSGAQITDTLSIFGQGNPFTGERLGNGRIRILHRLHTAFSALLRETH